MKKILFIVLSVVVLAAIASFVFIPSDIKISSAAISPVNHMAAHRVLMNDKVWSDWWPREEKLSYNGSGFSITKKMLNSFELSLTQHGVTTSGVLQIIPIKNDTVRLVWSYTLQTDKNPINRFIKYKEATTLKKNLDFLLDTLSSYLGKNENIYGFEIKRAIVSDSVLISTRKLYNHYPDEFEIDLLIQKLRTYIKSNNAKEMNYPMLNVHQLDSTHYDVMVAIATGKKLKETKDFAPKALFKGGNLLETELTGGHNTIENSFSEFENYKLDYRLTSPAIPYQLLITDRVKERDTLLWKTKICYPIF